MNDTSAIIVCAGSGTRMGGAEKMLLPIKGVPVAGLSMLAFEKAASVREIIVVTRGELIDELKRIAEDLGITKLKTICEGGSTRQESAINGVRAASDDTTLIAVHDGARPLVKTEAIERTCADARLFGGALLGVPVKDTIKVAEGGLVTDTPNRANLYIAQTPQVFRRRLYIRAVEFALDHDLDFTDDCQLVEAVGGKVQVTVGDYKNIKITTAEDAAIANVITEELQ